MKNSNEKADNVKIVFSIVSILLMLAPLVSRDGTYYRTLFIFLINRVIDMTFKGPTNEMLLFKIWALWNQWAGVLASAIAFCLLTPDFFNLVSKYMIMINAMIFTVALSCVLNDATILISESLVENVIKITIKSDIKRESKKWIK